jgi:hypothetical protein
MQRVALARALINDPAILLADEPTGNLDTASAEQIGAIFEELNKRGLTIIAVTHSAELSGKASRQVRLLDGRVVDDFRLRPVPSLESVPEPVEEPSAELEPVRRPASVQIPEYMPLTLKRRRFGHPAAAAAMALTGTVMFAAAFMPFIGKFSGSGLLDQSLFVVSIYSGGNLTRTFVGKPALIFTGLWPIILGALLIAAGFAFLMNRQRSARWAAIIIGGLAMTLPVISISTISSRLGPEIAAGSGYWVFLGAGAASLALGVFLISSQRFRNRSP